MLSLAPYAKEATVTEQGLWSNLTVQFYEAAQQAKVEVRVGYFGLCARLINTGDWACTGGSGSLIVGFGPDATDAMDIMNLAERFKSEVILPGLM